MFKYISDFTAFLKEHFESGANWIKLAISILIALVAIILIIVINKISKSQEKKYHFQKTSAYHIALSAARYIILLIAVLAVLQINGINVTAMITSLGVVGVVVGIGLKDVFDDVFAGAHIFSDHFFKVGDVITFDGDEGVVESLAIRTTTVRSTITNNTFSISNRLLTKVHVVSRMNDLNLPIAYEVPLEEAETVLNRIARQVREFPSIENCTYEGIAEFGSSAIMYRLRFWCDPKKRIPLRRKVNGVILKTYNEHGIAFPYNKLDVNLNDNK